MVFKKKPKTAPGEELVNTLAVLVVAKWGQTNRGVIEYADRTLKGYGIKEEWRDKITEEIQWVTLTAGGIAIAMLNNLKLKYEVAQLMTSLVLVEIPNIFSNHEILKGDLMSEEICNNELRPRIDLYYNAFATAANDPDKSNEDCCCCAALEAINNYVDPDFNYFKSEDDENYNKITLLITTLMNEAIGAFHEDLQVLTNRGRLAKLYDIVDLKLSSTVARGLMDTSKGKIPYSK